MCLPAGPCVPPLTSAPPTPPPAFFEPDASTGAAPSDPTSLVLARTFSSSLGDVKNATLPAVHAMLDSSVQSCTAGLAAYGDIAPKVKERKDLMLEADAYKSKVDQLRAAPPKNDPDKLPRNEEKLAKACADLAKANNELIEKLVAMERAKPALLAKDLRNIVDASYLLFQQAEVRLENVMAKMAEATDPTPSKAKTASAAARTAAASTFEEADVPAVSFTPAAPVHAPPPRAAPVHAHAAPDVASEMEDFNPFGAPAAAAAPAAPKAPVSDAFDEFDDGFGAPPPPPPPQHGAAGKGVLGVDDFDSF